MPSVFALRMLLGAGLGLGALDVVWINAALAPRLVEDEKAPARARVTDTVSARAAGEQAEMPPAVTDRAPNEPAAAERTPNEPAMAEPAPNEPAMAELAPNEPAVAEPAMAEPAMAKPTPSEPVPNQPAEADVVTMRVYFATGSAVLDTRARNVLARLAASAGPTAELVLQGHADYRGDEARNETLSKDRAVAVEQQLVQLGIARTRIRVGYLGEGDATSELWRDRRVDIQITGGTR